MKYVLLLLVALLPGCDCDSHRHRGYHITDGELEQHEHRKRLRTQIQKLICDDESVNNLPSTLKYEPIHYNPEDYNTDYKLTWTGGDGAFGTPDDVSVYGTKRNLQRIQNEHDKLLAKIKEAGVWEEVKQFIELTPYLKYTSQYEDYCIE